MATVSPGTPATIFDRRASLPSSPETSLSTTITSPIDTPEVDTARVPSQTPTELHLEQKAPERVNEHDEELIEEEEEEGGERNEQNSTPSDIIAASTLSEQSNSKTGPLLEPVNMPPPPPDSPHAELAPRKRRRKREDPQSCFANSEVRLSGRKIGRNMLLLFSVMVPV